MFIKLLLIKHLKMKTLVIENDYLHATSESIWLLNEIQ